MNNFSPFKRSQKLHTKLSIWNYNSIRYTFSLDAKSSNHRENNNVNKQHQTFRLNFLPSVDPEAKRLRLFLWRQQKFDILSFFFFFKNVLTALD